MIRTRKFLAPYDSLLSALGCPAFSQPPPLPPRAVSCTGRASLGSRMNEFRCQNQFIDVHFEAEGVRMPAHRIVLAATSDFCKSHFAGHWGSLADDKLIVKFEYGLSKLSTLSKMLDFAYGVAYTGPQLMNTEDVDEIADKLDEILDVLICADGWQIIELRDQVEDFLTETAHASIYRRADNVEHIKQIADKANAKRLARHCEEYMTRNKAGMDRLKKGSGD